MNLRHILRAAVCAAIATVCAAAAECFPIQPVAVREIEQQPRHGVTAASNGKLPEKSQPESIAPGNPVPEQQIYQPGLRNGFFGRPLSAEELELVLAQLRQKTGFARMRFDEAGFLKIGDRSLIVGGSALARKLLLAAVDGKKSINLQSHNRSPKVAFAQVGDGVEYSAWRLGTKIVATPIEIDFDDFTHLRGHREAMEAFDLGFVILHELCHAALGLRDPSADVYETGDCESYVNRIRRELGLPERQQYAASGFWKKLSSASPTVIVAELVFAQSKPESGAKKKLFVQWEAQMVGGIRRLPSRSKGKGKKSAAVTLPESGLPEKPWNPKH